MGKIIDFDIIATLAVLFVYQTWDNEIDLSCFHTKKLQPTDVIGFIRNRYQ